jgi:hypothetical protein
VFISDGRLKKVRLPEEKADGCKTVINDKKMEDKYF